MKWIFSGSVRRFLVAAVLALGIPLIVAAGPRMLHDGDGDGGSISRPGMAGGEMLPQQWRSLDLDEGQRDRIFAIMHEQAPAMRERLKSLGRAEAELRRLAAGADYDEVKAGALADAVGRAAVEVALLRARTEHLVGAVLTPEQRKRLTELKSAGGPKPAPGDRLPPPVR